MSGWIILPRFKDDLYKVWRLVGQDGYWWVIGFPGCCSTKEWGKIVSLKSLVRFRGLKGNLGLFKGRKTI
jgi:hypothetical protein